MDQVWLYTLGSVIFVSLIPLLGIIVIFGKKKRPAVIFALISLAVGALFGDVFLHLVPEIYEEAANPNAPAILIISGLIAFFILEKFLHWRHEHVNHHDPHCDGPNCEKIQPVGYITLVADGLHNFIDGSIITVSFAAGIGVGIATTIAVILHEIPQEIGDIGILLHAGFKKTQAIIFNIYSGLAAIIGAVITLLATDIFSGFTSIILPLAAGGFIYIAGADLVPELHKTTNIKRSFIQLMAIIVGILLMYALTFIE